MVFNSWPLVTQRLVSKRWDWWGILLFVLSSVHDGVSKDGRGARQRSNSIAKLDLKNAYRIVPMHQEDRWHLWVVLSTKTVHSPGWLSAVVHASQWHPSCDTLLGLLPIHRRAPVSSSVCSKLMHRAWCLRAHLGVQFPVVPQKIESPSKNFSFLGIMINIESFQLKKKGCCCQEWPYFKVSFSQVNFNI